MVVKRRKLEPATTGYDRTWRIRIIDRGLYPDLTGETITALASLADASVQDVSFTVTIPGQTGDDRGLIKVTGASTDFTTAREGRWYLDVYRTESGANAEPLPKRFSFLQEPKETEA
jgi:hypothetical protein